MVKDIMGGTESSEETHIGKPINIESSTKSTKPLSEVLKGLRNINIPTKDINTNVNSSNGVLIVLLDTSSSMCARFETSTRIKIANEVLRLQLIPNMLDWQYGIIKFGGMPSWYVLPTVSKNALVIDAPAIGGTAMLGGLKMAWEWIHKNNKGARIILISDGEPTDAGKQAILETVSINNNIPIDTVGIGDAKTMYSGYDLQFLRELSRITGGIFCEAHSVKQLADSIFKLSPVERPLLGVGK